MAKDLSFVLLLDCYGELMTERQRSIAEMYFNDDLSFSEIAETEHITRQAVRDSVHRSQQSLLEWEEKLGMAERLRNLRECLGGILQECEQQGDVSKITALARKGLQVL